MLCPEGRKQRQKLRIRWLHTLPRIRIRITIFQIYISIFQGYYPAIKKERAIKIKSNSIPLIVKSSTLLLRWYIWFRFYCFQEFYDIGWCCSELQAPHSRSIYRIQIHPTTILLCWRSLNGAERLWWWKKQLTNTVKLPLLISLSKILLGFSILSIELNCLVWWNWKQLSSSSTYCLLPLVLSWWMKWYK